jgi:hypothetical protein
MAITFPVSPVVRATWPLSIPFPDAGLMAGTEAWGSSSPSPIPCDQHGLLAAARVAFADPTRWY